MEPQDPTENPFAPEYPHIQEWVMEAETKLAELDQEMARTGVAPRLELRPPNPMGVNQAIQVRRSRADIQQEKDEKKATVYKRVEKETEKAEQGLKKQVQDIAFGRLYREEIGRLLLADRGLANPAASWSINDVQVKTMAWIKEHRDTPQLRQPQAQLPERGERTVIEIAAPAATAALPAPAPAEAAPAEPKQLEGPTDGSQGGSQGESQGAPQEPEQSPDIEPEP